jgi:tetratricopeptide (TPR) repeat protein
MRKLFDRITERLNGFIAQRDRAALVVRCRDADGIAVLKILEGLDEASTSEMYWKYTGDFLEASSYVSEVIQDFAAKHEGASAALEFKKMTPWPPIPADVLNESLPAAHRLREVMIFSRSLLPQMAGGAVVWVLFPLQINDSAGYAHLVQEVLQHQYPFPWFHHMRIILREDTTQPVLSAAFASEPRVDYYAPDLSDEAMEHSLEEEAADTELPLADRVQATFLSAQHDYAFGRFDEALKKHDVVLRYHAAIGNAPMIALVLNSVGEIHQRAGRPDQASRCFEAALEPACAGQHPPLPVLCNVLLNLANLRLAQNRFAEAEVYYDSTEKLSTVLGNPPAKIQSIESLGYCQYMQGKANEAAQNWKRGASIAGQLNEQEPQRNFLLRLRHHYASTNQVAELREVETQLLSLATVSAN